MNPLLNNKAQEARTTYNTNFATVSLSKCPKVKGPGDENKSSFVETIDVAENELAQFITQNAWTPASLSQNKRLISSFISADILGLDIDAGCSLEDALAIFKPYKHIIGTSKSHGKVKNAGTPSEQPACDRFRVVLFSQKRITTQKDYAATMTDLQKKFPFIDKQCKDSARFFHPCTQIVSENLQGKLVESANIGRLEDFKVVGYKLGAGGYGYTDSMKMANLAALGTASPQDLASAELGWQAGLSRQEGLVNSPTFPVLIETKGGLIVDKKHPDNLSYLIKDVMGLKPKHNELKNLFYINDAPWQDSDSMKVRQAARRHGLADNFVDDALTEISLENSYHPFKQAVESRPWDGHDYITDLFNTLELTNDNPLYFQYLQKWLVGVVAKVYRPGAQNLMLVLNGGQGEGKNRWFDKFAIAYDVYGEGAINPENKDHQLRHVQFNIWCINELDGVTRKADAASLKEFLTISKITARESYGHYERSGYSALSFCAATNEDSFLLDVTGNRRYLVLPVKAVNYSHTVDMQQVFAQAKALLEQDFQYWFDKKTIAEINSENDSYVHTGYLDHLARKVLPGDVEMTKEEVVAAYDAGGKSLSDGQYSKLGQLLKKQGILIQRRVRNGQKVTVYLVKEASMIVGAV